jgi:hypothetical protein
MTHVVGRLLLLVGLFAFSNLASAAEQIVAKLSIAPEAGKPTVEVSVVRVSSADGGVAVKVLARTAGAKPLTLVVYQGGGEEDGAGDKDLRGVSAAAFELGAGKKALRVDVGYHPPDEPKRVEQTDTTLVAVDGKPRAIAELITRRGRDRSKVCRELTETQLAVDGADLIASTGVKLEPALSDDDLPIDRACRSSGALTRKVYKWSGEKFVEAATASED